MATSKTTFDERKWQAEDDARTMAHYEKIMVDKASMNRAIKAARSQANELKKRASAMNRVASTGSRTSRKKQ